MLSKSKLYIQTFNKINIILLIIYIIRCINVFLVLIFLYITSINGI